MEDLTWEQLVDAQNNVVKFQASKIRAYIKELEELRKQNVRLKMQNGALLEKIDHDRESSR